MTNTAASGRAEAIGFLHPGAMGVSVAAAAINSGRSAFWSSAGRSPETRRRAEEHGLEDAGSLEALCRKCTILFGICPPHGAEQLATDVMACGFSGIYVDANAISPKRVVHIAGIVEAGGARFVDGGIIGPPAWQQGTTRLYLAGNAAETVAACFGSVPLDAEVIGDAVGTASSLKMCYAAHSKGVTALLAAILATAGKYGVDAHLQRHWMRENPAFGEQTGDRISQAAPKAWRFTGEMEEIASTFSDAGQPDGFHLAAAQIFRRLARFKQPGPPVSLDNVLRALQSDEENTG